MLIDCSTCVARDRACGDCVITVLLGRPPVPVELDATEQQALDSLAGAGLVPPLRLMADVESDSPEKIRFTA